MGNESEISEGWGWPLNSKKAHRFRDSRSLCGKWLFFGRLETSNDASADNCVMCKRKMGVVVVSKKR